MQEDQTSFVEHFDQVVETAPLQVAVESCTESITYAELRQRSLRIASRLTSSKLEAGDVVALHLEKSAAFLAAAIACWRLGCAWGPIAPELPDARRGVMLNDCAPRLVLTDNPEEKQFLFIGDDIVGELPPVASRSWQPSDLAYVIYTSGTTGQPSGVEVTHRGIMNLLRAQVDAFRLSPGSRSIWFYPTSFDASVSDWGTALYAGATLLVEPSLGRFAPAELAEWLLEKRVSHADLPPSLLQLLPESELESSLETIVIGGQATAPETIRRWASRVRLVNVYGPTEATVCTSLNVCEPTETRALLGQPISKVAYHVVDSEMNRVPAGQEGELLITGPCLARGYRNQPQKTREKFVEFEGQKSYRSGDRVRQDTDGAFVFCGRIDRQISLNGLRLEPEEIEAAIVSHPQVSGAAVLLRKIFADSTKKRLVAFVETSTKISDNDICSHLRRSLPSERLPQWFEYLTSLPKTRSGKVDVNSLASHALKAKDSPEKADGLQATVQELFAEATGEIHFGTELRWKDWGADSLSAMHLVTLAAKRGLEIPLGLLGLNPTPKQVVEYLETGEINLIAKFPNACSVKRLRDDAERIFSTTVCSMPPKQSAPDLEREILLTGATGFLGARVLAELLRQTNSHIVCLIRPGLEDAKDRLLKHLNDQELELGDEFDRRVTVQLGDVASPSLGMSEPKHVDLLSRVGTVVHCAADINALASYEALRATNVQGTANVLQFSQRAGAHLHHASTLSVFVGTDEKAAVIDEDTELSAQLAFGGYTQSKLAAEFLLVKAPVDTVTVHRLGLLTAGRRTGVYPPKDILTSVVRGLLKLGCVPRTSLELRFDVTPVDYAAAALAATVSARKSGQDCRRLTHLAGRSSMTLGQLLGYLRRHGAIHEVALKEFFERVAESANNGRLHTFEAAALHASFSRWLTQKEGVARELDLFQATGTVLDSQKTGEFVESQGIVWPQLSSELIDVALGRICEDTLLRQT